MELISWPIKICLLLTDLHQIGFFMRYISIAIFYLTLLCTKLI